MKTRVIVAFFALLMFVAPLAVAQNVVTVDPMTFTAGYMHVFELDMTYAWGSGWGFADLVYWFDGAQLVLEPNQIGDPNEYWYQCVGGAVPPDCGGPGAPGNKIMQASGMAEVHDGSLNGDLLIFSASVISDTFTDHTVRAFIKEFDPGWGLISETYLDLTGHSGPFNVSAMITSTVDNHVQYGIETQGVNVWFTDIGPFGTMVIGPESVANDDAEWGSVKAMFR